MLFFFWNFYFFANIPRFRLCNCMQAYTYTCNLNGKIIILFFFLFPILLRKFLFCFFCQHMNEWMKWMCQSCLFVSIIYDDDDYYYCYKELVIIIIIVIIKTIIKIKNKIIVIIIIIIVIIILKILMAIMAVIIVCVCLQ